MQFITKNNKKKQNPKCKKCKKPTNKLHNTCWDCHLKNEMKKLIIREIGRTKKWEQNYKSATTYNNFNKLLETSTSEKQLKRAYKKGVLKIHPNKGGNSEKFVNFKNLYNKKLSNF
tara:strand:+ start:371 stop:718 length:348 start_codon:yes stop_codon:yes gene_type:complete